MLAPLATVAMDSATSFPINFDRPSLGLRDRPVPELDGFDFGIGPESPGRTWPHSY
jgi:hypothetical protein